MICFIQLFQKKLAILLCSLAGSQYFSNGNKRLAVIVFTIFLLLNDVNLPKLKNSDYKKLLQIYFPDYAWEDNTIIKDSHPLFLYNLAIVIGDRTIWGKDVTFDGLKQNITNIFSILYRFE